MRCLNTDEVKRLLNPGEVEDLTAVVEHVSECDRCRAELRRLAAHAPAVGDLTDLLLDVAVCPDYDALSAFVDSDPKEESMKAIRAHVNLCDLCANDVEHIRTLRSHAGLRGTVEVSPRVNLRGVSVWSPWLRRITAGAVVAGAVVAGYLTMLPGVKQPGKAPTVAVAPTTHKVPPTTTSVAVKPEVDPQPATTVQTPVKPSAAPSPKVILVDGRYTVAKQAGKTVVLRDGSPVAVSQGLMAKMAQKLASGRVGLSQPVALAMSSIKVRGPEDYVPPPTAPKLTGPVAKIVMTNQPMLTWSGVQLAKSYRVVVKDADGNMVYEAVTSGNRHVVRTALTRGREYIWQVGVRFNDNDGWTLSRAARFKVLSSDDLAYVQGVSRSLPGSHLALGVAYESVGLAEEAAREYRALKRANPGRRF